MKKELKSFTLISGSEGDWYWAIIAQVNNKEQFTSKGKLHLLDKEINKKKQKEHYRKNIEKERAKVKEWRIANPQKFEESNRKHHRNYYINNREKVLEVNRDWAKRNIEAIKEIKSKWRKSHPDKIREDRHKRRQLGFIPLNKPFLNCDGHHIDKNLVIYIPTELHQSIGHNVFTGKGMKEINALAFQWIATQENFEGLKEIGGKKYENHTDEDGQK